MLFPYLLKVSFLLAILTLSYRWLIKYETFSKVNRILLLVNVAAAWSLPMIPLNGWGPTEVQTEFHQTIPLAAKTIQPILQTQNIEISSQFGIDKSTFGSLLPILLTGAYLLGLFLMSIRLLYQLKGILYLLWSVPSEKLGKQLRLIRDTNAHSPYSFFQWIICDPEKHSSEQLQHILAHEWEHSRQWHSADLLVAELQRVVLWFNPFAWFHQRLVQENLEYMADHGVLKNGFEKKRYQFSLVNVALRTSEIPLTNSFAQSLLKSRIKMMNRKRSGYWVLGKYALLITLLYVSSAFVAPYKDRIIALSPSITKPLMEAVLPENKTQVKIESNTAKLPERNETSLPEISTTPEVQPDIDSSKIPAKGILIRNDTLYWAISALTTWEDLNLMRKEIKSFGADLNVTSFKLDPLNLFLTLVSVNARSSGGGSWGQINSSESEKEDEFKPIRICSGFLLANGIGMGQLPPARLLASVETDYQRALVLKKKNEVAFLENKIISNLEQSGITSYEKENFEGQNADWIFDKTGFGKSSKNTIKIGERLNNAAFYINGKPVSVDDVKSMHFNKFISVKIADNWKGVNAVLINGRE